MEDGREEDRGGADRARRQRSMVTMVLMMMLMWMMLNSEPDVSSSEGDGSQSSSSKRPSWVDKDGWDPKGEKKGRGKGLPDHVASLASGSGTVIPFATPAALTSQFIPPRPANVPNVNFSVAMYEKAGHGDQDWDLRDWKGGDVQLVLRPSLIAESGGQLEQVDGYLRFYGEKKDFKVNVTGLYLVPTGEIALVHANSFRITLVAKKRRELEGGGGGKGGGDGGEGEKEGEKGGEEGKEEGEESKKDKHASGGGCLMEAHFWMFPGNRGDRVTKKVMGRVHANGWDYMPMQGWLQSPNCNVTASVQIVGQEVDEAVASRSAWGLLVVSLIVAVLQVPGTVLQLHRMSETPAQANRVSVSALGLLSIVDTFLTIVHLIAGFAIPNLFIGFFALSLWEIFVVGMLAMRTLFQVWRAHRPHLFADGPEGVRRELGLFYVRFYGVLISTLVLLIFVPSLWIAILLFYFSYFLFQIVFNVFNGAPDGFHNLFFASAASRVIPVVYLFGCPYSLLVIIAPDVFAPMTAFTVFTYVALQMIVLLLQRLRGPRFFVPRAFLPKRYDYFRPVDVDANGSVIGPPPALGSSIFSTSDDAAAAENDAGDLTRLEELSRSMRRTWNGLQAAWREWRREGYRRVSGEDGEDHDVELGDVHLDTIRRERAAEIEAEGGGGGDGSGDGGEERREVNCAICLAGIDLPLVRGDYMVTPCQHLFHAECLSDWMEVKLECPVCRGILPEMET